MRTNRNFTLIYILLVIGQILICNFINTGPYLMLSVLPALILCLPPGIPVSLLMLMAAISGLAVDWLAEGITGLNMAALVPVAFVRNTQSAAKVSPSARTACRKSPRPFLSVRRCFWPYT